MITKGAVAAFLGDQGQKGIKKMEKTTGIVHKSILLLTHFQQIRVEAGDTDVFPDKCR